MKQKPWNFEFVWVEVVCIGIDTFVCWELRREEGVGFEKALKWGGLVIPPDFSHTKSEKQMATATPKFAGLFV